MDHRAVAIAAGIGVRALVYKLPTARQAFAAALDSLDLL
jgi:hypothetical protein